MTTRGASGPEAEPDSAVAPGLADANPPLPPDPAAYDSERATQARARGLAAPYIAGGLDPDIEETRRRERRDRRLLIAMIVIIVLAGFVLGIIANLLGLTALTGPS